MLKAGVRWFDDWYAIEEIAPGLFAIGEPRYYQLNWNYLITGSDRALLFDTGPGLRDIEPVIASLTRLPLTVMPSHLHYDHTGNLHRFPDLAMADLPVLKACEREGVLYAPDELYLAHEAEVMWKPVRVAQWWAIGHLIDLGDICLEIIHTPGHSPDSVSLYDRRRGILLASDFLYPGDLYAQKFGASLPDYLETGHALLQSLDKDILILGAHGDSDTDQAAPRLVREDLSDLVGGLTAIRNDRISPAELNPDNYALNSHINILVGAEAYGHWR